MNKSNITAAILISLLGISKTYAADPPTPTAPPAAAVQPAKACEETDGFRAEQKAAWQAHRQQQETENKAFRATLEGKSKDEKKALIEQHRAQQETENKAFRDEMHAKAIAHIQASNKTEAQKAEAISKLKENWAKEEEKNAARKSERKAEHASKGDHGKK